MPAVRIIPRPRVVRPSIHPVSKNRSIAVPKSNIVVNSSIIVRRKRIIEEPVILHSGNPPRWRHCDEVKILWRDGEYYCAVIDKPTVNGYRAVFSQYGISRDVDVKKVKALTMEDVENAPAYWCSLCKSETSSAKTLMNHIIGKKHLKKVTKVDAFISKHDLGETGKKVDLRNKHIESLECRCLGFWLLTNTMIRELYLENNDLEGENIESLVEGLAATTTIKIFDCRNNPKLLGKYAKMVAKWGIEATSLKTFSTIPIRSLKENDIDVTNVILTTSGCGATEAYLLATALDMNTTLKSLDIRGNQITGDAAEVLATTAMDTHTLETLSGISIYALKHNLGTTTTLDLNGASCATIGDIEAFALGIVLETNTTLTALYLQYNKICDAGCRSIGQGLKTNNTLTELWLNKNSIGHLGADALAEGLRRNNTMIKLDLRRNLLGQASEELLQDVQLYHTSFKQLRL